MPEHVKAELVEAGVAFTETRDLREVLADSDVLYVTRVQRVSASPQVLVRASSTNAPRCCRTGAL